MTTREASHRVRSARLAAAAAVAAITMAAFAGCGSGDEPDGPEGAKAQGPSKSRYIARADGVCRDALRETVRLGKRFNESLTQGASGGPLGPTTEGLFAPGLAIRERQARRLRRLERPAGDGAALDAYLDLFGPIEELIRERIRLGHAERFDEARHVEQLLGGLSDEQAQAARSFGFRDCDTDVVKAAFPGAF